MNITHDNYEEYLLLYIDNELDERTRSKVDEFISVHEDVQQKFIELKQTVLPFETIVFKDKSTLYKKQTKVISLYHFTRLAAAAAFIGIILLCWWMIPSQKDSVQVVKSEITTEGPTQQFINAGTDTEFQSIAYVKDSNNNYDNESVQNEPTQTVKDTFVRGSIVKVYKFVVDTLKVITNTFVQESAEDIATVKTLPDIPVDTVAALITVLKDGTPMEIKHSIQPKTYKVLETDDDDGVYIAGMELNKHKVNALLKKASNVFTAKTKRSTEE